MSQFARPLAGTLCMAGHLSQNTPGIFGPDSRRPGVGCGGQVTRTLPLTRSWIDANNLSHALGGYSRSLPFTVAEGLCISRWCWIVCVLRLRFHLFLVWMDLFGPSAKSECPRNASAAVGPVRKSKENPKRFFNVKAGTNTSVWLCVSSRIGRRHLLNVLPTTETLVK